MGVTTCPLSKNASTLYVPIVCALDRGPKKASSGPGGSQAGGKEHVSVSETPEVKEVRGQSPGLVRGAVGRVAGRNEAQRKRCGFSEGEGRDRPPRQKVGCPG